ncbi:MAG: DUF6178 family protein [Desulfarculaceae bacterium]|jgi:hypothetical protein
MTPEEKNNQEHVPSHPGADPQAWLQLENRDPRRAEKLWQKLSPEERLRVILAARGNERERLITLARDSKDLVQILPPDEFMRTVLEVGQDDAGMLLELCSDEQLTYLLDLTGWVDGRLAPVRYESWIPLIMRAGALRLGRWLASTDLEVLALMGAHWFQVVKYVPSSDEQEPPDDLPPFTLDGIYHLKFRNNDSAELVAQVLVHLKSETPHRYEEVMETMLWEPASLLAEQAQRWRQGRLMDHGFPDRLEALELWAKPRLQETDWSHLPEKASLGFMAGAPARSDAVIGLLTPEQTLPQVAGALDGPAADALRAELAYIANCGVQALGADPTQPEQVEKAAQESLGLVNLGLELAAQAEPGSAAAIVARVGLPALARKGARAVRELNQRAWALLKEGWLKEIPAGVHVLDEPLDRCLAGLIFPRPRYFDPNLPGHREYRSFLSLADLEQSRRYLDQAWFWGRLLFELLGLEKSRVSSLWDPMPEDPASIKISAVIGTWLARRSLGMDTLEPIPRDELSQAVSGLQKGLAGPLRQELIASCQGLSDPKEASLAGEMLRGVFARLEQELGGLDPEDGIEPEFINGLVIGL